MNSLSAWHFIKTSIDKNLGVMLLYVLESHGSSPGRQGFFMAVNSDSQMRGSIGGGIMEHKFVELANDNLRSENCKSRIRKQIHSKSAKENQSGMICSGEQTIFICRISNKDSETINNIINCLENHKSGVINISQAGIRFLNSTINNNKYSYEYKSETEWNYFENLDCKNNLYIVGGGHCALAFSKIMRMLDFYIHLFDDRKDLNTFLQNDFVDEKMVVKNYSSLARKIPSGENNYVVIMTYGYRTDAIALRVLIDKKFKYLGLLGSKTKIDQMFAGLLKEGISKEKIKKIYSPIGIPIKSQTPEEIAVSIAAEIIGLKNSNYSAVTGLQR